MIELLIEITEAVKGRLEPAISEAFICGKGDSVSETSGLEGVRTQAKCRSGSTMRMEGTNFGKNSSCGHSGRKKSGRDRWKKSH